MYYFSLPDSHRQEHSAYINLEYPVDVKNSTKSLHDINFSSFVVFELNSWTSARTKSNKPLGKPGLKPVTLSASKVHLNARHPNLKPEWCIRYVLRGRKNGLQEHGLH